MLTAYYSMRLINLGFMQEAQGDKKTYTEVQEPGAAMAIPLIILGVASIYIGYVLKDMIIGPGAPYIEFEGLGEQGNGHHSMEAEMIPT
jgi:NADH-ubiquinone oxidoreductase chain 5